MSDRTDEELMRLYVSGDHAAFHELWQRYSAPLERAVLRRTGSSEAARDITQQAFLQFHRARNDFREGSAVRPWLYTIALNLARDWGRKKGRRTFHQYDERDFVEEPVDYVERAEDVERVRAALAELDERHREVIELHWFEGLSFREISEVTGDGLSALKVRAHRTYEKLRKILGEM